MTDQRAGATAAHPPRRLTGQLMTAAEPELISTEPSRPNSGLRASRALARRAIQLAILLFGVSTVLFILLRITGDPAVTLAGEGATPSQIEQTRQFYGLDRAMPIQYGLFLAQIVRLDFGRSYVLRRDALDIVIDRLPATLALAAPAAIITLVVAIVLGTYLGSRPRRPGRRAVLVGVLVSQGIPGFVVGLLLIQVFVVEFGWFPSVGRSGLSSHVLPALTLASFLIPRAIRLTASNVEDAMSEQFVRTARAGGQSEWGVIMRHVLRNAILGTVALIGVQFGFLLGGAMVTETLFTWPGLGTLMIDAVRGSDFPILQAGVFIIAICVFATTTLVDVVMPRIDPRLRQEIR